MATNGVSLRSTFWSLVWRKKRVLIRSCSRPWAWTSFLDFEESTHRFHTYNWWGITILAEKKQNKRVINVLPPTDTTVWHEESREDMSNSLFWTGVPVTTHRREARSLQTACYMPAFGLWITWASSKMRVGISFHIKISNWLRITVLFVQTHIRNFTRHDLPKSLD